MPPVGATVMMSFCVLMGFSLWIKGWFETGR
jgi:hypothetical protein